MSLSNTLVALLLVGSSAAAPVPEKNAPLNKDLVIGYNHVPKGYPDCYDGSPDQNNWNILYRTYGLDYFQRFWGQTSGCPQQINYCLPWWQDVNDEDNVPDGDQPAVTRLSFDANIIGRNQAGVAYENRTANVYSSCDCSGTPDQVIAGGFMEFNPGKNFCSFKITNTTKPVETPMSPTPSPHTPTPTPSPNTPTPTPKPNTPTPTPSPHTPTPTPSPYTPTPTPPKESTPTPTPTSKKESTTTPTPTPTPTPPKESTTTPTPTPTPTPPKESTTTPTPTPTPTPKKESTTTPTPTSTSKKEKGDDESKPPM